ncbi:Survival of motor neuron-related-splicing factor 30-like protein [Drosera capensis]
MKKLGNQESSGEDRSISSDAGRRRAEHRGTYLESVHLQATSPARFRDDNFCEHDWDGEDYEYEEVGNNKHQWDKNVGNLGLFCWGFEREALVKLLLADDPGNLEYLDTSKELEEVIALTEEVLATAKQKGNFASSIGTISNSSHMLPDVSGAAGHRVPMTAVVLCETELTMKIDAESYPNSEMETDQTNSSGHHEIFDVGTKVQAVYSEDGEWYNATIVDTTPNGYYVLYDGWGNKEEVDPANIRPIDDGAGDAILEAERQAEATRQALKRKIAQAAAVGFQSRSLPAKLRVNPDDPEDVKAAKRKKIHAFKSKARLEEKEVTQNKRQNAWQEFQNTKGRTKKVGFFSGRKRESIFKSPDDPTGKVGVVGSGKGLTDFQKREKHLHLKGGNIDSVESEE